MEITYLRRVSWEKIKIGEVFLNVGYIGVAIFYKIDKNSALLLEREKVDPNTLEGVDFEHKASIGKIYKVTKEDIYFLDTYMYSMYCIFNMFDCYCTLPKSVQRLWKEE